MTALLDTLFGRTAQTVWSASVLSRLNSAMALYRSRSRLAQLEPHMLADIGLTQTDADTEANRPVWDAPSTWKA